MLRADDRRLIEMGEFVQIVPKPVSEARSQKDQPGFEKLLDRISITPSAGSSPTSFILAGRVVSGNTGAPLERISIYVGAEGESPKLAAMTNVDGEFKFRLWIKEDHRDPEIHVPPSFVGYLYVDGRQTTTAYGETRLVEGFSRRYPLQRLRELATPPEKK